MFFVYFIFTIGLQLYSLRKLLYTIVYFKQLTVYMNRIFVKTNDIATLEGISVKRASEIMRTIMDCFQKEKTHKLLIIEYCQYRGIPETVISKQITK